MKRVNREKVLRTVLTLIILLSGLALVPFIDKPVTAIGWKLFAGIYTPLLEANETTGAPGSVFTFTGSNYPPDSVATIYINGKVQGVVTTDQDGMVVFLVNTQGALPGAYDVTVEVDLNASATNSFSLNDGATVVTAPPSSAPVVDVKDAVFFPSVAK